MTLDVSNLMKGIIEKNIVISHMDSVGVLVCQTLKLPSKISSKIKKQYGEMFLNDANYIIAFKNTPVGFNTSMKKKILKLMKNSFENSIVTDFEVGDLIDLHVAIKSDVEKTDDSEDSVIPDYLFVKITLKK